MNSHLSRFNLIQIWLLPNELFKHKLTDLSICHILCRSFGRWVKRSSLSLCSLLIGRSWRSDRKPFTSPFLLLLRQSVFPLILTTYVYVLVVKENDQGRVKITKVFFSTTTLLYYLLYPICETFLEHAQYWPFLSATKKKDGHVFFFNSFSQNVPALFFYSLQFVVTMYSKASLSQRIRYVMCKQFHYQMSASDNFTPTLYKKRRFIYKLTPLP